MGHLWGTLYYSFRIMSQRLTSESFIVRVYRVDTENSRQINGLVQTMEGAGPGESFADIDELGEILNNLLNQSIKKTKRQLTDRGE